jgi:cytochrome c oxidase subunit 1
MIALPLLHYANVETTFLSWLVTKDHKRIGVMFLVTAMANLLVGGIFALLLRIELLSPTNTIMQAMTYNQLFTLHGVVMVFLFMIPAIPAGFGNFLLPIMIGAEDVAFPRINLLSWYVYLLGTVVTIAAMLLGGADTGWTFYAPYSTVTPTAMIPVALGVFIVGWSSILTGLNFIATVHTLRAKGLGWFDIPLFVWAIYATSIIQVLATPVLGISLVTVLFDRLFDFGIFDPARGGDPRFFQHLFWFYSHPAVYIMVLPAMGVITEVVCSFARKNPISYKAIAFSSLGIAFVGFLTWGHHIFVGGISVFASGVFGILSMLTAIFSAVKTFVWVGTLYRGSIKISTPMFYVFAFLFLFVFGGMTGVAVASMGPDIHWHDTYFVVAHFHFVMVGAVLTAFLAALHYWFPKITGRCYNDRVGMISASLVFLGFFGTFFPQFLLGNAGMPRRYFDYPDRYQVLHVISTCGSWLLALGLVLIAIYLLHALTRGAPADRNPWGSRSFEWRALSPPPPQNFDGTPEFSPGTYDYHVPQRSPDV